MGSFLDETFRIAPLVLIIALLFNVYNSHAQTVGGIGQQEPVKITGMLAANLTFCNAHLEQQLHNCKNFFSSLTIGRQSTDEITQAGSIFEYIHRIPFKVVKVIGNPEGRLATIQACYPLG